MFWHPRLSFSLSISLLTSVQIIIWLIANRSTHRCCQHTSVNEYQSNSRQHILTMYVIVPSSSSTCWAARSTSPSIPSDEMFLKQFIRSVLTASDISLGAEYCVSENKEIRDEMENQL